MIAAIAHAVLPGDVSGIASSEDIQTGLQAIEGEIEYLDTRLADDGLGAVHERLRTDFIARRARLTRARDFFASAARKAGRVG